MNPHYLRFFSLLVLGTTLFFTACQEKLYPPSTATVIDITPQMIDDIVEQEMALQNIVGITVGVVENGVVTHTLAYGHRDQARDNTVTTSTVFRYASISKPVTAIATFRAITDGHLELNDKVDEHVSYWPSDDNKDDITVAHLLSHRSGINHYGRDTNDNRVCTPVDPSYTPSGAVFDGQTSVDRFKHCDLLFTPNTNHRYSSYAYDLLGAVIENATGTDYVAYVNQHIKDVADLNSLTSTSTGPGGYDLDCNLNRTDEDEGNVAIKIPGGGWASNIRDLARFMQGVINSEFIPASYALWQPVTFPNDNDRYVYGFKKRTRNNADFIYHGGAHDDVRTFMGFFPGDKNGVCVMMNTGSSGSAQRVGERLLKEMGYTSFSPNELPRTDNGERLDCGERMVSIWRNNGNGEETIVRRGLSHDDFLAERNALAEKGWYLVDMESYPESGAQVWDGIFRKDVTPTSIWRGFTTDGWLEKWEEENEAGRRLIDIETYKVGTSTRWAGLFQTDNGNSYAMWRNFNTDDFGDKYFEMKDEGRKLIDVETYIVGTTRKWAGVWLGTGTSLLNRNYNQADFIQLCRDRFDGGYRLIDVETYVVGATRKYAGVWEPATEGEARWFNINMGDWVNEKHIPLVEDGYELLDLEKF
ncbi:MAG: serine hydrolase [Bacteroidota bacterium]